MQQPVKKQTKKHTKKQLAFFALNQLLDKTELSEVYYNLDLCEKLTTDKAEQKFLHHLAKAAKKQGLVLDGENLRPFTDIEEFLISATGNTLTSVIQEGIVRFTLQKNKTEEVIGYRILTVTSIPALILQNTLQANIVAHLAYIYFVNTQPQQMDS